MGNSESYISKSTSLQLTYIASDSTKINSSGKESLSLPERTQFKHLFEWKQKANEVYLIGSFTNWTKRIKTSFNAERKVFNCQVVSKIFNYCIKSLYEGVYFYRFLVDSKPCVSFDYPQKNDSEGREANILVLNTKDLSSEIMSINSIPSLIPSEFKTKPRIGSGSVYVDHVFIPKNISLYDKVVSLSTLAKARNKRIKLIYFKPVKALVT